MSHNLVSSSLLTGGGTFMWALLGREAGGGGALRWGVRPLAVPILRSSVFGEYGAGLGGGAGPLLAIGLGLFDSWRRALTGGVGRLLLCVCRHWYSCNEQGFPPLWLLWQQKVHAGWSKIIIEVKTMSTSQVPWQILDTYTHAHTYILIHFWVLQQGHA